MNYKVAIIGAGNRGNIYANYFKLLNHTITTIIDSDLEKIYFFSNKFNIEKNNQFKSIEEFFSKKRDIDIIIITTPDKIRLKPIKLAIKFKYNILVEKPVCSTIEEVKELKKITKNYKHKIGVCHVLRHSPFYQKIKDLIKNKTIGEIQQINATENVGYYHFAHSYVRGNWHNKKESSPFILAKCCHDFDIFNWLLESEPISIHSFGSLSYFKNAYKPELASNRCYNCKLKNSCVYSASIIYKTHPLLLNAAFPHISLNQKKIKLILETSKYGRCVYSMNNDVVDHQVVNIKYPNDIYISFSVSAFTKKINRTIRILGSEGEICGNLKENKIKISFFNKPSKIIKIKGTSDSHGAGDYYLIENFIKSINDNAIFLTDLNSSISSHLIAFAAEKSRKENKVINFQKFSCL